MQDLFTYFASSPNSLSYPVSPSRFCPVEISGEDIDVGRQRFDLSVPPTPVSWLSLYNAHATNKYSWCNVPIFRPQALQTRSDFPSHRFNVNPIFSHCFARTTPIEPFCFEGWSKFSVPIWRAWLPCWTLKEQLQSRQKFFTEGKRAFLLRPTFFFGVSSDIIFTRSHLLLPYTFNLPRKLIDACHFQPMGFRFAQAK